MFGLLRLCETYNALQLPVFFFFVFFYFSFFCQLCPVLWNCKSVFVILKISQFGGLRRWIQLSPRYSCKNWNKIWYLHFHKTCDYQILQAGTSRGAHSNETNKVGTSDVITSRSCDKRKPVYLHYHSAYVWSGVVLKNILLEVIFLWLAMMNTRFHHSKPSNYALEVVDSCGLSRNLDLVYEM